MRTHARRTKDGAERNEIEKPAHQIPDAVAPSYGCGGSATSPAGAGPAERINGRSDPSEEALAANGLPFCPFCSALIRLPSHTAYALSTTSTNSGQLNLFSTRRLASMPSAALNFLSRNS